MVSSCFSGTWLLLLDIQGEILFLIQWKLLRYLALCTSQDSSTREALRKLSWAEEVGLVGMLTASMMMAAKGFPPGQELGPPMLSLHMARKW